MKLTREQVVMLAKYEMELYEEDRKLPSEDVLRYGKEADDILNRRDQRLPVTRRLS